MDAKRMDRHRDVHDSVLPDRVISELLASRAAVERLERRERVLGRICSVALGVLGLRAAVAIVAPELHAGGRGPLFGIAFGVVFAGSLGGLLLARRWAREALAIRQQILFLEMVEVTLDAPARSGGSVHPYRSTLDGSAGELARAGQPSGVTIDENLDADPAPRPRGRSLGITVALPLVAILAALLLLDGFDHSPARRWTFTERDASAAELGFRTPLDHTGSWTLLDEEGATGGRALVNDAGQPIDEPALALANDVRARDLRASTRCMVRSPGTACGVVFRARDPGHYYAARADARSGHVSLSVVVNGEERLIDQRPIAARESEWQDVGVELRGVEIVVTWNGTERIRARDATLTTAGTVGLWARSADVALFDELTVEPLPENARVDELLPILMSGKG